MDIEILYVPDCPNVESTLMRLDEALSAVGRAARVEPIVIESEDAARARGMRGSPTILVDGMDPFATADAECGLACRLFHTPTGLAGAPTTRQLIEVLAT